MNNLQNGWQVKSLGEVVTDIRYGMNASADFINDGIKFLRVTDIATNGSVNYSKLPNVVASIKEAEKYFLKEGDCVIARSGSVGKAHIFNGLEIVVFASYLIRLKFNKDMLYPPYFGAFSQTRYYWDQIISNTKGGVQQNINTEGLSRIKIPLPPLPIQKQIAEILEKADQAKQKRKEANKLTDEFMQSVFIEMFGDPVKNPMGWERVKAKKLFEIKLGKMRSEKHITGKHLKPYLRNINVQWGRLDLSDIKQMDFDPNEQKKYSLKKGDILVCEGGEVGRTAIWNGEVDDIYYQNAIHRLRTKSDQINSMYFLYFMFFAAKYGLILRRTSVVTIAHFTAEKFNEFEIMLPPLQLQQQFAEIVNKTEVLKEKQKQSEQELENLFQSLMQRAFKGELVY